MGWLAFAALPNAGPSDAKRAQDIIAIQDFAHSVGGVKKTNETST